jgi:glycogen synthase
MRLGMRKDYSWRASAAEYAALYRRLLDGGRNAASFGREEHQTQVRV